MTEPTSTSILADRSAIQEAVLETVLVLLNQTRFAFFRPGVEPAMWRLLTPKSSHEGAFANPDLSPHELGLVFEDVRDLGLAEDVMRMYDYGVLGMEDVSNETLDSDEGSAAWTSRLLHDLRHSSFLVEWDSATDGRSLPCVDRCLQVAELANARVLLEGGQEGFFLEDRNTGYLTFRQLSLLSGMTEASLRTMTSRGAGLKTIKDGNATFIAIEDAKTWLVAKNRYTPIRRVADRGAAPLTAHRFHSVEELCAAIDDRVSYLVEEIGLKAVKHQLARSPFGAQLEKVPAGYTSINMREEQLLDRELMRRLGRALQVPPDTLALRAAETVHGEKLRQIEAELKGAVQ